MKRRRKRLYTLATTTKVLKQNKTIIVTTLINRSKVPHLTLQYQIVYRCIVYRIYIGL